MDPYFVHKTNVAAKRLELPKDNPQHTSKPIVCAFRLALKRARVEVYSCGSPFPSDKAGPLSHDPAEYLTAYPYLSITHPYPDTFPTMTKAAFRTSTATNTIAAIRSVQPYHPISHPPR